VESPDLTSHSVSTLIGIADRVIADAVDTALAAAGFNDLRRAHGPVFEMLDPAGSRITELARRARMTRQGMGQLITDLETLGYVERRRDPSDARAKLVVLTAKGEAAVTVAVTGLTSLETRWVERLGEQRAREFRQALVDLCQEFGREHIR
jgi:DNA-binding MarR family transcriptional regulator